MLLQIDTGADKPIYEQLRNQIVLGIASGQLLPDEPLPSVRRLAADLGINLHTVNKAYAMLCGENYLVMDRRKGATVAGKTGKLPDDGGFVEKLKQKLTLAAAEARCMNLSAGEFKKLCEQSFLQAGKGGKP